MESDQSGELVQCMGILGLKELKTIDDLHLHLLSDFVTNSYGESWDSPCEKS